MTHTVFSPTWTDLDLPVLRQATILCEQSGFNQCTTQNVASALGFDVSDVIKSVNRLSRGNYLDAHEVSTITAKDFVIKGATERGLREVGIWPNPEQFEQVVLQYILNEIDNTPAGSPNAERLAGFRDLITGSGAGVIATAISKGVFGA